MRWSSERPKPPEGRYREYSVRDDQQGAFAMSGKLEAKVSPVTSGTRSRQNSKQRENNHQ